MLKIWWKYRAYIWLRKNPRIRPWTRPGMIHPPTTRDFPRCFHPETPEARHGSWTIDLSALWSFFLYDGIYPGWAPKKVGGEYQGTGRRDVGPLMVLAYFLGILGDEITHKYLLYLGLILGISHRGPTLGSGYIPAYFLRVGNSWETADSLLGDVVGNSLAWVWEKKGGRFRGTSIQGNHMIQNLRIIYFQKFKRIFFEMDDDNPWSYTT